MSAEPRELTGDAASLDADMASFFSSGVRVGVVQMGIVAGRLGMHSMGHGVLISPPQIGALLRLRIRGTRGFASSRIRALRAPARGYLLAATDRSVYLVALPKLLNLPHPAAVAEAAVEMVQATRVGGAAGHEMTQYVRLEIESAGEDSVLPRGPIFASVERTGDAASTARGPTHGWRPARRLGASE